jgi:glutathione S-transferase
VVEALVSSAFLVGTQLTLADLWVLPMLFYLKLTPGGAAMLRGSAKLGAWLERMQQRPSVRATRFRAETAAA